MKRCVPIAVFVLALLLGALPSNAQTPNSQPTVVPQLPSQINYGEQSSQDNGTYLPQPSPPTAFTSPGSNNSLVPSKNSVKKFSPIRVGDAAMPEESFNGFAQIRAVPDLGAPGSAGNGFHHFTLPFDRYTQWYRPRAATLTKYQRCEPDLFRPRGFGNLFARPYDGYSMEYEPYMLGDGPSKYGPSYIARMPDPRCDNCCHCGRCRDKCECK